MILPPAKSTSSVRPCIQLHKYTLLKGRRTCKLKYTYIPLNCRRTCRQTWDWGTSSSSPPPQSGSLCPPRASWRSGCSGHGLYFQLPSKSVWRSWLLKGSPPQFFFPLKVSLKGSWTKKKKIWGLGQFLPPKHPSALLAVALRTSCRSPEKFKKIWKISRATPRSAEGYAKMCGGLRVEVRRATPRGAENILYGFYIHLWATRRGAEGYVKKCGGLRLEVRRATPRSAEGYGKKCGGLRLEVRRGVWGVKIDPNQKIFFSWFKTP